MLVEFGEVISKELLVNVEALHESGEARDPETLELEPLARNQGVHHPKGCLLITVN